MPGRIAFVCAMPMELTPLRKKLSLDKASVGSVDAYTGSLAGRPVVAIITGMGTELAAAGVERLLEAMEVERVVVVGITGAVDGDMPIGTLIHPEMVVHGGTGVQYRPERLGGGVPNGRMWTTDELIVDLDVIAGLRVDGVVSLDMETAAIAAVCERRSLPWSVFRAISDQATDGSVNEEVFRLSNQDGTPNAKAVASYVLRHPLRVPAMARMAKHAKVATQCAADAGDRRHPIGDGSGRLTESASAGGFGILV